MSDTVMDIKEAIDQINGEINATNVIREYIENICGYLDYEIIENKQDSDLRIKLNHNEIGGDEIESLLDVFKITFINANEDGLEMDLEIRD